MVVCVLVPLRMDGDSLWQSNKYTFRKYHIDHMKGEKYAENFSEFLNKKRRKKIVHRVGIVSIVSSCGIVYNWNSLLPAPETKTLTCHDDGNSFGK